MALQSALFRGGLLAERIHVRANYEPSPALVPKSVSANFGKSGARSRRCSARRKGRRPAKPGKRFVPSAVASRCRPRSERQSACVCGNTGRRGGGRRRDSGASSSRRDQWSWKASFTLTDAIPTRMASSSSAPHLNANDGTVWVIDYREDSEFHRYVGRRVIVTGEPYLPERLSQHLVGWSEGKRPGHFRVAYTEVT